MGMGIWRMWWNRYLIITQIEEFTPEIGNKATKTIYNWNGAVINQKWNKLKQKN